MPYIAYNGQLYSVTQTQYDSYTIGGPLPTGAVLSNPNDVAAGGITIDNSTTTTPILVPNTTNNSPGQMLNTVEATVATPASTSTLQQDIANVAIVEAGGTVTTPAPVTQLQQDIANVAAVEANQVDRFAAPVSTVDPSASLGAGETIVGATDVNTSAPAQEPDYYASPDAVGPPVPGGNGAGSNSAASDSAGVIQGLTQNAQGQQTFAIQRRQVNNADWRVRLRLAPESKYLYNASQPGILQPLKVTDGIIFPYTPSISTSYRANYTPYDLTHSNYRGYWYSNSYTDAVQINGMFTAQDTNEANYLLAVIHFLRSATKMFYGQDAERGSPPPVVYLSGLGQYQFKEHPCLIQQFTYNLPADIDYIRAGSPNQVGLNLVGTRDRQSVATNSIFGQINRLANAFLNKGAINQPPAPPTLGLNSPAYVPTKMEIQITLLPIQSRNQVSKQFSLKGFANGDLIKGGFW